MKKLWKNKVWRAVLIIGAVLLIIGIGFAAHHGADPIEANVVTVKPKTLTVKLPENGILSLPQTASIAAQATGNVLRVYAREGQRVQRGELLMKLDDRRGCCGQHRADLGARGATCPRWRPSHAPGQPPDRNRRRDRSGFGG